MLTSISSGAPVAPAPELLRRPSISISEFAAAPEPLLLPRCPSAAAAAELAPCALAEAVVKFKFRPCALAEAVVRFSPPVSA